MIMSSLIIVHAIFTIDKCRSMLIFISVQCSVCELALFTSQNWTKVNKPASIQLVDLSNDMGMLHHRLKVQCF